MPAAEWLALTRAGRGVNCTCHSPARLSAGTAFLWSYDLPPGDYLVMDLSISELGYRQFNGAGATIVELTRPTETGVSASAANGHREIHTCSRQPAVRST